MAHQDKKAYSRLPPIGHVEAVASILSLTPEALTELASEVETLWKPGKLLRKKSGAPRPTFDAKKPLKSVHETIKNRLLKTAFYPDYLLGGIADSMSPRDHKKHASIHAGKTILISEDVKDFFPSTSVDIVNGIWKNVFCCHPEVADLLTSLTTLDGSLPQGWKTSGYLANLAFWDLEPQLASEFSKRGFAYSRFMDDITVSSQRRMNNTHKVFIVSRIYRMLSLRGYAPKRSKHQIRGRNQRMEVTGLTVNSKRPTIPPQERARIRAAVHQCQNLFAHDTTSSKYRQLWNSTSGRVANLTRFHPGEGQKLRECLTTIKPR